MLLKLMLLFIILIMLKLLIFCIVTIPPLLKRVNAYVCIRDQIHEIYFYSCSGYHHPSLRYEGEDCANDGLCLSDLDPRVGFWGTQDCRAVGKGYFSNDNSICSDLVQAYACNVGISGIASSIKLNPDPEDSCYSLGFVSPIECYCGATYAIYHMVSLNSQGDVADNVYTMSWQIIQSRTNNSDDPYYNGYRGILAYAWGINSSSVCHNCNYMYYSLPTNTTNGTILDVRELTNYTNTLKQPARSRYQKLINSGIGWQLDSARYTSSAYDHLPEKTRRVLYHDTYGAGNLSFSGGRNATYHLSDMEPIFTEIECGLSFDLAVAMAVTNNVGIIVTPSKSIFCSQVTSCGFQYPISVLDLYKRYGTTFYTDNSYELCGNDYVVISEYITITDISALHDAADAGYEIVAIINVDEYFPNAIGSITSYVGEQTCHTYPQDITGCELGSYQIDYCYDNFVSVYVTDIYDYDDVILTTLSPLHTSRLNVTLNKYCAYPYFYGIKAEILNSTRSNFAPRLYKANK